MNVKYVPSIKKKLLLKLRKEKNPPSIPELIENLGEEETIPARRQSLPLPVLESSFIVYEENIPVVARRRGVTLTVRIFGAEDSTDSTQDTNLEQDPELADHATEARADNSTIYNRSFAPTRWLVSPTRKQVFTRSADSLYEHNSMRGRRHSVFSGRFRHLSSPRFPSTPDTDTNTLSPKSPDTGGLRSESPTHGIGLFKKVSLHSSLNSILCLTNFKTYIEILEF